MKKFLGVSVTVLVLVGLMFYLLVRSATSVTHIHFNNRGGVLQSVIYYSERPPELSSQHQCDQRFADMRDDLYESHLQMWQERYGGKLPWRAPGGLDLWSSWCWIIQRFLFSYSRPETLEHG